MTGAEVYGNRCKCSSWLKGVGNRFSAPLELPYTPEIPGLIGILFVMAMGEHERGTPEVVKANSFVVTLRSKYDVDYYPKPMQYERMYS